MRDVATKRDMIRRRDAETRSLSKHRKIAMRQFVFEDLLANGFAISFAVVLRALGDPVKSVERLTPKSKRTIRQVLADVLAGRALVGHFPIMNRGRTIGGHMRDQPTTHQVDDQR